MFKKTFSQVLKDNLTEEAFQPKPKPPPPISRVFENEIKEFYVTVDDIKKTFSQVLKNNLTQEAFQPNPKPPPPISRVFKNEIKEFYVTVDDIKKIYGSRSFYKKLFKEPVKMIFFWCEEEWQGSLFVVYVYKNKYIYTKGYFGSCEVCDSYPQSEESILKKFNSLCICDNIDDVNIHGYNPEFTHNNLVKDFEKFKNKINRQKIKSEELDKEVNKELDKEVNKELDKEVNKEVNKEVKEIKDKIIIKNWASLFK